MQNVSNEFKDAIKSNTLALKSKIDLPGLNLNDEVISKIDIDSALVFSEDFEIGTAPMDTAKIGIVVDDVEFGRNLLLNSGIEREFDEDIETTVEYYDEFEVQGDEWGRNLILNGPNFLLSGSDTSNRDLSIIEGDYISITPTHNGNVYNNGGILFSETKIKGEIYTLSFEVATLEDVGVYFYPSEKYTAWKIENTKGEWKKVSFTYTQTGEDNDNYSLFGFHRLTAGTELKYKNLKLEKGSQATPWTPAPEDFNNLKGVKYNLSTTLKKDQWYTLSVKGDFQDDDFIGVWLSHNKFIGYLQDNKITFKADEQFDDDYIIVKSLSEEGVINKIWLTEGKTPLPWSIAPEDILDYSYEDKEFNIKLGIKLPDESIEYVDMGLYTIEKAVKKDNKITLNCVDRMYKAEKDFKNNLMFPTTILDILQSACEQSGIELATLNFANADYVVPNEPVFEGVTCRTIFAQVAELAGGYARINRQGKLEIVTLNNNIEREITKDHYFEFKIDEVAIGKIDKVIVKVGDETAEKGEGEHIYTIVDNMFVQDPNDVIDGLYEVLKDVNYIACDINFQGDFSLDLGDKIEIEDNETYILSRRLKYTGGLREDYRAPAKSNVEKESTGKSNILLDMNNIKTQIKVIEGEISQTIEKVENLVVDAENRLYQSQTQIPFDFNQGTGTIQLYREAYHPYYKVVSDTNIDLSAAFPQSQYAEDLTGEEVTISLDVLVEVDRLVTMDGKSFEVPANRWTRIHVTKMFPDNTTRDVRVRVPYSRKLTRDRLDKVNLIDSLSTNINTIYYRNVQVQKGNVPSNWTLTPEELEENVTRLSSELKQLEDSISLLVRKNQDSGRFEVNVDGIIAEINKTDGVGKVKSVKVTVDDNGLTVDDGAVIIRDSQNTAIITSQGLKIMFIYTSSGDLSGWQRVGAWEDGGYMWEREAYITFRTPDKLQVTNAELITRSIPTRWTDWEDVPDGMYHARNLRLFIADSGTDGVIDYPAYSGYGVMMGGYGRTDLTNEVWGGVWSPTGNGIREKIGNVTQYIEKNKVQSIGVASTDAPTASNKRYRGGIQFILILEGYLRG